MTANPTRGAWLVRRAALDEEIVRLTKRLAEPSDRSSPRNRLLDFESRRRAQERLTVALAERFAHGGDPGPNAVEFGFDWLAGHTGEVEANGDDVMSDTTIKIELSTADLREALSEWATKRFGATFGQGSSGACPKPWKVDIDISPAEEPDPPYAAPTPASVLVTASRKP